MTYAGIYLHIPYCHQACSYCDFYFSTHQKTLPLFLQALKQEIALNKDFLPPDVPILTLYFGGGTPSILSSDQLQELITCLKFHYDLSNLLEFTIEVNPEDINEQKLTDYLQLGVNRLSLGIQSLHDHELQFMRRPHDAHKSVQSLQLVSQYFTNYSVDIIYGTPNSTLADLQYTVENLLQYQPAHFSCYALTIEPNTLLNYWQKNKRFETVDEHYVMQYEWLTDYLTQHGYHPYELSNFAKDGMYSKHNSLYWKHYPYLGLGPAAHSFKPYVRSYNRPNVHRYIEQLLEKKAEPHRENEHLHEGQIALEKMMFLVRQNHGIEASTIPEKLYKQWTNDGLAYPSQGKLYFTPRGLMLSDKLLLELVG